MTHYEIQPEIHLSNDSSGERIDDFRQIRANAKKTIFVMGIGMTFFSQDKKLLDDLLNNDIKVRLLIINPEFIKTHLSNNKKQFEDNFFENYFDRKGYISEIETSYNRLVDYINKRKNNELRKGRIELRKYSYFYPINFTIADEKEKKISRMLFEYVLPLSENRVRLKLNNKEHFIFYKITLESCEKIWMNSETVIKDF